MVVINLVVNLVVNLAVKLVVNGDGQRETPRASVPPAVVWMSIRLYSCSFLCSI